MSDKGLAALEAPEQLGTWDGQRMIYDLQTLSKRLRHIAELGCEGVLVRDLQRCIQCGECEAACERRHDISRLSGPWDPFGGFTVASVCRSCDEAACIDACRREAMRRTDRGVFLDQSMCAGCGLCARACHFDAISITKLTEESMRSAPPREESRPKRRRIVTKCDRCHGHRHEACIRECPTEALHFMTHVELAERLEESWPGAQLLNFSTETAEEDHEQPVDSVSGPNSNE